MCSFDEIDGFNIEYEWEEAVRVIEEYQSETIPHLEAENAGLRAEVERLERQRDDAIHAAWGERDRAEAAYEAAAAWKRKAYQWRNEAANALGLWPIVGWRVAEFRRRYREYIR